MLAGLGRLPPSSPVLAQVCAWRRLSFPRRWLVSCQHVSLMWAGGFSGTYWAGGEARWPQCTLASGGGGVRGQSAGCMGCTGRTGAECGVACSERPLTAGV